MFKFYGTGMSVNLCIIDTEIVSYYKSLPSDEARMDALTAHLKLGAAMHRGAKVSDQINFTEKLVNDA